MVQIVGFSNSFSAGELGEDVWERTDLAQHQQGCAEAINMIGVATGPCVSRGGTWRVGIPKAQDKAVRFIPWLRADGEGLVLEFGHLYFRVWTARGVQVLSGGLPVEVVTPWTEANLAGLRLYQVGDIALVTHRDSIFPRQIARVSDTSWTVGFVQYASVPWLPENVDDSKTLTLTDLGTGFWSVVSSSALFTAGHVGSAIRIRSPGVTPGHRSWSPNTLAVASEWQISNGRVYLNLSGAIKSGNTPPSHERGEVSDGAITWRFIHDGATPIYLTAVADSTHATAVVPLTLPIASGGVTANWSLAAYSDAQGWPTAMSVVREERVAQAATPSCPDTIDLTRTAGFSPAGLDFKPGLGTGLVLDTDAVRLSVGQNRARIVWLMGGTALVAGTTEAEWIITGGTVDDPLSPASATPRQISAHGSADVMPVLVSGPPVRLLHVARGRTTLREMAIGPDQATEGRDLSMLASHIFGRGVAEMAWQRPDSQLWLRLDDGGLAIMTLQHEHGVLGARTQLLGGDWKCESLCASPDPDGRDRIHIAGYRDLPGGRQRAHLVAAPRSDNVFMEAATLYSGAPATVISGFGWAEGELMAVRADGAEVVGLEVAGGAITLPTAASEVLVGHNMLRRFKSLPLDLGGPGSMTAKQSRVPAAYVVLGCVTADVNAEAQDSLEPVATPDTVDSRRAGDAVPVVRRKRQKVTLGSGVDRDVRLTVQTWSPFDLAVYALRPIAEAN